MAGEINGTDVGLGVELVPLGGTFGNVGGVLSQSITGNNGVIDLTNKSSAGFREIMAGEGLQSIDLSAEVIFSTDANFILMKDSWLAQTLLNYELIRGADKLAFAAKIASWAETHPDNDKVVVSISLQSSGTITDAP